MSILNRGIQRDSGAIQPWLPPGMSFLSGLPEPARKRRLLMPMQAFVDDSGGKGNTRHFVLAGLIGHSEAWAEFSNEWRACLDERPRIRTFKMREAATCNGQFYSMTAKQRDEKLRKLAQIINRYALITTHSVIDLDAHEKTWAKLEKPRNEPYFWPFHNTIMATCFTLWDAGWREKFEIIFDEQVVSGLRAKVWYPVIRAIFQEREPEASRILPVEPMFKTDDEFLPIQAADLFAWCYRKSTDDPEYNSFNWLLEEMGSVKQTDYSQYYDQERMEAVTEESMRLFREGLVPDVVVQKFREIIG